MRLLGTFGSAVSWGAAIALLAACSGAPVTPSSPGTLNAVARPSHGVSAPNGTLGVSTSLHSKTNAGAGWLSPQAQAGKALLFVADQGNQRVWIYPQKGTNPAPIGQITDAVSGPDGIYVDKNGTLYVCNFGNGTVTEYPKGQTTSSKTLTGAGSPKYVIAGGNGTVYVSDFHGSAGGRVLEYAGGSTTPTTTIPFQTFPAGIALDGHGRIYVAYQDSGNNDMEVLRFAPGKTKGKNLGIHVKFGYPGGATIDRSGNLLVADQSVSQVDVFPPGATAPSQVISGFPLAYQIALDHQNNHLYVSAPSGSVAEVNYPAGTPIQSITNSLSGAYGVAVSPK